LLKAPFTHINIVCLTKFIIWIQIPEGKKKWAYEEITYLVRAGRRGPGVLHVHPHVLRQVVDVGLEGLQHVKVVAFHLDKENLTPPFRPPVPGTVRPRETIDYHDVPTKMAITTPKKSTVENFTRLKENSHIDKFETSEKSRRSRIPSWQSIKSEVWALNLSYL
jgi:hypothetical protein